LDFHVSAYQLEITYYRPIFDVLEVNGGHTLKLNILTPKGSSLRDSTSIEPLSVKIRQRV